MFSIDEQKEVKLDFMFNYLLLSMKNCPSPDGFVELQRVSMPKADYESMNTEKWESMTD